MAAKKKAPAKKKMPAKKLPSATSVIEAENEAPEDNEATEAPDAEDATEEPGEMKPGKKRPKPSLRQQKAAQPGQPLPPMGGFNTPPPAMPMPGAMPTGPTGAMGGPAAAMAALLGGKKKAR